MMTVANAPKEMSWKGLVEQFARVHKQMPDRRFAFVLGAGASKSSGIKTAGDLVDEWLHILHKRDPVHHGLKFDEWRDQHAKALIDGFESARSADFYPQAYSATFKDDPDDGFAYMENAMLGAEPRYGYAVLAFILAKTQHRVVITTNFDNLVADALANFENTFPIVCGHDALAGFAKPELRRPLILKVHHDLFFAPKSQAEELKNLGEGYTAALRRLLARYVPIVIGYGGNDGSLMAALAKLPPGELAHGVYWCYRDGGEKPKAEIQEFVAKQNGRLVAIPGFDELMTLFGEQVSYELPDQRIKEQADKRAADLIEHRKSLREALQKTATSAGVFKPAAEAVLAALHSGAQTSTALRWWQWVERADAEVNVEKRDELYGEAIAALPTSPSLLGNYAIFLSENRKDFDRAQEMYERALKADPNHANNLGNYANFLSENRKDFDRAQKLFERAIEADPNHANSLCNYAIFLSENRKDVDRAQEMFERAIKTASNQASTLGNYAVHLSKNLEDFDRAEEMFKRAIKADPSDAHQVCNYAIFLSAARKDNDRAQEMYERAIDADPNYANSLFSYANFLSETRKDFDRAQELFERAIKADPSHAKSLGSYAVFLTRDRNDPERAHEMFERAIKADPNHASNLGNYANFLSNDRQDFGRAQEMYERAIKADPNHPNNLGNYANFLRSHRKSLDHAQEMYERAIKADPNHAKNLGNYALFLSSDRNDLDRAQEIFERAIKADPNHASVLGNYAQVLLGTGKQTEGVSMLNRAFAAAAGDAPSDLRVELLFYRFVHDCADEGARVATLASLGALLKQGMNSQGWDFGLNIAQAKKQRHPEAASLERLAHVASGVAGVESLSDWPLWQRI